MHSPHGPGVSGLLMSSKLCRFDASRWGSATLPLVMFAFLDDVHFVTATQPRWSYLRHPPRSIAHARIHAARNVHSSRENGPVKMTGLPASGGDLKFLRTSKALRCWEIRWGIHNRAQLSQLSEKHKVLLPRLDDVRAVSMALVGPLCGSQGQLFSALRGTTRRWTSRRGSASIPLSKSTWKKQTTALVLARHAWKQRLQRQRS